MKAAGRCPPLLLAILSRRRAHARESSPAVSGGHGPRHDTVRSLGAGELLQLYLMGTNCSRRPAPCKVPLGPVAGHPRTSLPRPPSKNDTCGGTTVAWSDRGESDIRCCQCGHQ